MVSNHTNSSHILLYDDREINDIHEKEWGEKHCYGPMINMTHFDQFEKVVGGYFNCTFGTLGLIGNILSILVLCRKEMRKNCFSQLLIGKDYSLLKHFNIKSNDKIIRKSYK